MFCVGFLFTIALGVDSSGSCGALVKSDPLNACLPLRNGHRSNETDGARFALIVRGECAFQDKVLHAQNAGFSAAIVYDDRDREDLIYSESPGPSEIWFTAFIALSCGFRIIG